MANPSPQDEATAESARAHLKAAIDAATEAARGVGDPDRAYAAAKLLVEDLRAATRTAGQLHAACAARIHDDEDLSYAALGARLGVSKARAEQLVKLDRRGNALNQPPSASP